MTAGSASTLLDTHIRTYLILYAHAPDIRPTWASSVICWKTSYPNRLVASRRQTIADACRFCVSVGLYIFLEYELETLVLHRRMPMLHGPKTFFKQKADGCWRGVDVKVDVPCSDELPSER